jgi:Fe-S-cluster containining protein
MSFASNFLVGERLLRVAHKKLDALEKQYPTAEATKAKKCCRSGVCCWRRPGGLDKSDVPKIAEKLKLTPQELFSTLLVVDRLDKGYVLLPRREHQVSIAGKFVPWRESYSMESPCVFLQRDGNQAKCKIHSVKPTTCRSYKCWEPSDKEPGGDPEWTERELKDLGWSGDEND